MLLTITESRVAARWRNVARTVLAEARQMVTHTDRGRRIGHCRRLGVPPDGRQDDAHGDASVGVGEIEVCAPFA